jgi:glycosyltransferase involved in cell wall biosynthesis
MDTETTVPPLFFSIVIPAHNEEGYISDTLTHVKSLDYPKEFFEAIVVENGSTDTTWELAKKFKNTYIRVFSIPERGVARARNFGIGEASPRADWIVSLDADTILKPNFLTELNHFLLRPESKKHTVGTTELCPSTGSATAKLWFSFYNIGRKITRTSMAIQLFRRSLFPTLQFADMQMGEDIELIARARVYGTFFYLPTKSVYTSVRRFEKEGWFKVFLHWNFVALLPTRLQRKFDYKIVR